MHDTSLDDTLLVPKLPYDDRPPRLRAARMGYRLWLAVAAGTAIMALVVFSHRSRVASADRAAEAKALIEQLSR